MNETLNVLGLAERTHELLMPRAASRWPKDRPRPTLTVLGRQVPNLRNLGTLTFDADQYAAALRPLAELRSCG
ncbi:hypothetical protein [Micromonospora sp. CPCC 205558]|uniref:hypothetical protein n=1 Tax=Micromonospora sp. CPCC 205558 TaxID=3122403 RepID=UPI002FEEF16C